MKLTNVKGRKRHKEYSGLENIFINIQDCWVVINILVENAENLYLGIIIQSKFISNSTILVYL